MILKIKKDLKRVIEKHSLLIQDIEIYDVNLLINWLNIKNQLFELHRDWHIDSKTYWKIPIDIHSTPIRLDMKACPILLNPGNQSALFGLLSVDWRTDHIID